MKIAISCETAADLSPELISENDIKIVAFSVLLGDKLGLDGEITPNEIFEFVQKNNVLPKTSAINESQFDEHFSKILSEYDAVVHFSISSEMSSAYNNAVASAEKFSNVYVVDSRSLSTGIALLVLYAKRLADKGLDAKAIYEKCQDRTKNVQASFVLKRLDYLYKGGRCSALTLFGANLLKIRPQILVDDGKMRPGKKYRGNYENIVKNYCRDTLEEFNTPDLTTAFVTYTTASEEIVENAKNTLIERGFKNVYVTTAGATITSHCGEDCLGILYINSEEE